VLAGDQHGEKPTSCSSVWSTVCIEIQSVCMPVSSLVSRRCAWAVEAIFVACWRGAHRDECLVLLPWQARRGQLPGERPAAAAGQGYEDGGGVRWRSWRSSCTSQREGPRRRWRWSVHQEIAAHLRSEVDSRNKRGLRLLFFANDTTQAERVEPSWAGACLHFFWCEANFFLTGAVVWSVLVIFFVLVWVVVGH
jgi:hypothetical protein